MKGSLSFKCDTTTKGKRCPSSLVVAPTPRQHTIWGELQRRMIEAGLSLADQQDAVGIHSSALTNIGPILAVTSWENVLSALEHETIDDPEARNNEKGVNP